MKKILIIATAILLFILIMISVLTSFMKKGGPGTTATPTPTTVPINSVPNNATPTNNPVLLEVAKSLAPHETESFRYDYSPELNKMVVTEKIANGSDEFIQWIAENGLSEVANNPEIVVYETRGSINTGGPNSTPAPTANPNSVDFFKNSQTVINFMNIFLNFGQGVEQPEVTPSPNNSPTPDVSATKPSASTKPNQSFKYVYYAQCNGYGKTTLPGGCNLCKAGCGPTTVAMIATSYLGQEYNPKSIVDLYEKNNYYLSCAGSRYTDAKAALESLGLKTTSYMTYNFEKSDAVASDFKKYIDAGWTIFTLANYCDNGCGHFFWVTEVKNGEILAYDPFYGKSSNPPYNENSRYPFPKYRLAFGVKK